MSLELRLILYVAAFVVFCVEAVWHRSLTAAGLAAVTLVPLWDTTEAI